MAVIDDYIIKANEAFRNNDPAEIDSVICEIISAFDINVPNGTSCCGQDIPGNSSNGHYCASDLEVLIGKLRWLREKKDDELYGAYGLSGVTDSIRQLEDALANKASAEQLRTLYQRVDHLYANRLRAYVDGLCGWGYNHSDPSEEQTRLRIEKLRNYRDEEFRKMKIAELESPNFTVSQKSSQIQESQLEINITATFENIDKLPVDSLSEEDGTALKGMLADLMTQDEKKRESRVQKLLHWLGDKGVDVAIAVLPYVTKAINPGFSC